MVFSSITFIAIFLPITLVTYYLLHDRYRNVYLLIASLIFYAWGEPKFVIIMLLSILCNYVLGMTVNKYRNSKAVKLILCLTVLFNIGMLFIFKYLNFVIYNFNSISDFFKLPQTAIKLPIGISFFTFQAMSYVIDVYRENGRVQKNPLNVGLYIAFFPQLIAGPIVRYETFDKYLTNRKTTLTNFAYGVKRFIIGFNKKILLANIFAIVSDYAFSITNYATLSMSLAWLGAISYTLQIFFDFSAYSDMAIGLGKMFGFTFDENFNYPYISSSITEFWRRWHISLSTWFRDYIYIPLGGNRVATKQRLIFNLFIVWLLTGIWHGANWTFILWGMVYFFLLATEKLANIPGRFNYSLSKIIYRIFTLFVIIFCWVIFRSPNISSMAEYILCMLHANRNPVSDLKTIFYLKEYSVFYAAGIILSLPVVIYIPKFITKKSLYLHDIFIEASISVTLMLLTLFSFSELVIGAHNPFIYFNF